jgi:hypothetical protein
VVLLFQRIFFFQSETRRMWTYVNVIGYWQMVWFPNIFSSLINEFNVNWEWHSPSFQELITSRMKVIPETWGRHGRDRQILADDLTYIICWKSCGLVVSEDFFFQSETRLASQLFRFPLTNIMSSWSNKKKQCRHWQFLFLNGWNFRNILLW